MQRQITLFTTLVLAMLALMLPGHSDGTAVAGTATPNVSGTWEGTWSHRAAGSGQVTLRLVQEGTTVNGKQSVAGVTALFGSQIGRTFNLGEEIREGHIDDSTLIFNVTAPDLPGRQVNFTLTVSGETMTGTVCGDQCGTVKLKKSKM
jgi:hypothetical protein